MIAQTIIDQLGGNSAIYMLSGKNGGGASECEGGVAIKIASSATTKANRLRIVLDSATDTYTLIFDKFTPAKLDRRTFEHINEKCALIREFRGIEVSGLREIIESTTGLFLRL